MALKEKAARLRGAPTTTMMQRLGQKDADGEDEFWMPDDKVTFWYFPVVDEHGNDTYEAVQSCVSASGWRQCTHLAVKWLEQPLA